ncbi:MAG: DEAD/DEAH box helicase [Atopobiaceae bacterium]
MSITELAVHRRSTPATVARAEELAGHPTKFLHPTCSREGRRGHTVTKLDAQVKGSYPGNVYEVHATVDEDRDEIVDYSCTCPAIRNYWGCCKHVGALVLRYLEAPKSFTKIGDNPGRQTSPALFDLMDKTHPSRSRTGAIIDLEPTLARRRDGVWALSLRVLGPGDVSYTVKSIDDFCSRMRSGEHFSYGKKLAFTHTPEILVPHARKIERFLQDALSRRTEIARSTNSSYYYDYSRPKAGREMRLTASELISFLSALEGEEILFYDERSPVHGYAAIKRGMPDLGISIREAEGGYEIGQTREYRLLLADAGHVALFAGGSFWLCPESMNKARGFLAALFSSDTLFVAKEDALRFTATVLPGAEEALGLDVPESLAALAPEPCALQFYFDRRGDIISCEGKAIYGEHEYPLGNGGTPDDAFMRDSDTELLAQELLDRYLPDMKRRGRPSHPVWLLSEDDEKKTEELLFQGLEECHEMGEVFTTPSFDRLSFKGKPTVHTSLSLTGGLIDLSVTADDLDQDELVRLLASYREKRRYHRLKDGSYLRMAGVDLAELDHLSADLGVSDRALAKGTVELPVYEAFYLEDRLKDAERDENYKAYIERFDTERTKERMAPAPFGHILRGYQKEGFAWLSLLADCGFGGILADEMGLGKTVQLISWIASVKEESGKTGPHLIVCPASLVYNWVSEFSRFAPDMDVFAVSGTKSERHVLRQEAEGGCVLVTSYDILRIDAEEFAGMKFTSCTLDEAQYIKNHTTKAAKAAKLIQAQHRFALTGTPIENRPSEMWSIFDFLMPGLLGSARHFKIRFEQPIIAGDEEAQKSLQALVGPFILRRLKKDVLKDLPEKLESVVSVQMEGTQKKLYRAHEQKLRASLLKQKKAQGTSGFEDMSKIQVLAELTRLRQLCLDPSLALENYKGGSAKLDAIMDLVEQGIESGQKMLVFSQFTSFLDLIAKRLGKAKIPCFTITGSTPKKKRLELVDEFNSNDVPVFLISLKAGGTGLNLTGASIVIHADPWWNAAAERQATDRAHRIGQTHAVSVYKVIAKDTIEERIVELQEKKSALAESLMAGTDTSLAALTADDLIGLLSS